MKPKKKEESRSRRLPIYLLFGDEFLVKEELRRIVNGLLSADLHKTNLIVLRGTDFDESTFFDLVTTPSLFGDQRAIVVEGTTLFSGPKESERLASRVVEAARSGDEQVLLRYVGQLSSLTGLSSPKAIEKDEWFESVGVKGLSLDERELLRRTARKWLESGGLLDNRRSETLVEELFIRSVPEGTVLIFTADAVDRKKKSFRLLQEHGHVIECVPEREKFVQRLSKTYFDTRVKAVLKESGKTVSREALSRMYALAGTDLRRLHAELHKLLNYVGDKRHIDVADVDDVFDDFHNTEFFELTEAIRSADISRCLKALHAHLGVVAHPLQALSIITAEVRRLLMAKELRQTLFSDVWKPGLSFAMFKSVLERKASHHGNPEAAALIAKTNMKPYSLYLSLEASEKFSETRLLLGLEELLAADITLKSSRLGRYGAQAVLENVLLKLVKSF